MYWDEDPSEKPVREITEVVDLQFRLQGKAIPVDHMAQLNGEIARLLPWFAAEPRAAIHLLHAAASGNGWYSPEDMGEGLIYLSRRSKLTLRIPAEREAEVRALEGEVLGIGEQRLRLGGVSIKHLTPVVTLYARHLVADPSQSEDAFMAEVASELGQLGVKCKKMLCGKSHQFQVGAETLMTRSLMLANLSVEESSQLQTYGLGRWQKFGCGIFVPHKDIKEVSES